MRVECDRCGATCFAALLEEQPKSTDGGYDVDGEEFRAPARWMDHGNVLRVLDRLRRPLSELHGRARRRPEGVHGR